MISTLTEHINRDRKFQVTKVFNGLSGLQRDLLNGSKGCGIECRTMQLGALTRLLSSTSLLHYSPSQEYEALSVSQLLKEVEAAVCPTWYSMFVQKETKPDHYSSNFGGFGASASQPPIQQQLPHKPHECVPPGNAFRATMQSITQEVYWGWFGLSIKSY